MFSTTSYYRVVA